MTVSKVTGFGKSAGDGANLARVVYSGQDCQGRVHAAVWVGVGEAQAVTGFPEAVSAFKASLKDRRKAKGTVVSLDEASVTESSSKPTSQQSIFDRLYETAKVAASQAGKTLSKNEYSKVWEQAGVVHAQSLVSRRTKSVPIK